MIIELEKDNFFMLDWLDKYLVGHKGFVCGGCFKNIFNNEKVKDVDVFFKSKADWDEAVMWFDECSVGFGFDYDCLTEETAEYRFFYENSKVKAYKDLKTGMTVELCRSIFGEPKEIISQFDFTISKFAYYKDEEVKGTFFSFAYCNILAAHSFTWLKLPILASIDSVPIV